MSATQTAPRTDMDQAQDWTDWSRKCVLAIFMSSISDDVSPAWALKQIIEGVCDAIACFGDEDLARDFVLGMVEGRREMDAFRDTHDRRPNPQEVGPAVTRTNALLDAVHAAVEADRDGMLARHRAAMMMERDQNPDAPPAWADLATRLINAALPGPHANFIFAFGNTTPDGAHLDKGLNCTRSPNSAAANLVLAELCRRAAAHDAGQPMANTKGTA